MSTHLKGVIILFITTFTLPLTAQLEVTSGRVGIGRVPFVDAKLEILDNNQDRRYGLYLNNYLNSNATTYSHYVTTFKPTGTAYGAYYKMYHNSTSVSNNVFGQYYNGEYYGTGLHTGLHLNLWGYGGGEKRGTYTYVADNYGSTTSTQPIYGHYLRMVNQYRPQTTGYFSEVIASTSSGNSGREIYGFRFLKSGSSQGMTYGVHSEVPVSHGEAGYFDGNITVTGSVTELSDESLKTDIEDLTDAGDILRALRPRSYHFLDGVGINLNTDVLSFGFLAQEVEEVLPDLVVEVVTPAKYGYPEGTDFDRADTLAGQEAELQLITPSMTKKGIRYGELIPLLVRAFQEQADLLDALELDLPLLRSNETAATDKIRALVAENQALKEEMTSVRSELRDLAAAVADLRNCTDCFGDRPLETIAPSTGRSMVYPNPARGQLTVKTGEGTYQLVVRGAGGKERYRGTFDAPVVTLDVADWVAGLYLVEIVREGVVAETLKVTVVR